MRGFSSRNPSAWAGLTAARTPGRCRMPPTPSTAMVANQTSMTGPNALPMRAVPRLCTANKASSTTTAIGMTCGLKISVA